MFVFYSFILLCSSSVVSLFFFFKQKTAYEMRISDWSSDVCSSDLDQLVTMDNVHADLSMNDGAWWSLTSDTGYYDGRKRLLNLYGNIAVFSDNGYEMHGLSAEINLDTKLLSSDEKVWGHSSLGAITANGLRVYDKGRVIHFINGVKTTILPHEQRS